MGIRRMALSALGSRSIDRLCRTVSRRGAVLACHGILPNEVPVPSLHTSLDRLREQLEVLRDRGYRFVRLRELFDRMARGRSVGGCVSLTFDDAYRGLALALPLLKEMEVPATVFVPTAAMEHPTTFWWDRLDLAIADGGSDLNRWAGKICGWKVADGDEFQSLRTFIMTQLQGRADPQLLQLLRARQRTALHGALQPMSWKELSDWLAWEGTECAPHTCTHPVLPLLAYDEQLGELRSSHRQLLDRFTKVVAVAAYPYGLYDRHTMQAARDAGLSGAVTMDGFGARHAEGSAFSAPRIPFAGQTPPERVGFLLSGVARWLRRRCMPSGFPEMPAAPILESVHSNVVEPARYSVGMRDERRQRIRPV